MNVASAGAGAQFHDGLAASWNDNYRQGGFKRRLVFARALLASVVKNGSHWLDAGCGGGILTLELHKLGARGAGVDGSTEMIDAAGRNVGPLAHGFVFRRIADIAAVGETDGSFDGVLCSSVLEYVDNVDEVLRELNRVLKTGGTLVISVPNRNSPVRLLQRLVRRVARLFGRDKFPYLGVSVHDFTRRGLDRSLAASGFRTLRIQGFDPVLPKAAGWILSPALLFAVAEKRENP
jgi:2-polyprenyl-6-hydroxyphenyl methylase/3-demethylubiquinone-9 3-methyltransferase